MGSQETAVVMIMGLVYSLGYIFPVIMVGGVFYLQWRVRRAFSRFSQERDRDGRTIEKTGFAKVFGGGLPLNAQRFVRLGEGAKVHQTLNTKVLHTTIGIRLFTVGLAVIGVDLVFDFIPGIGFPAEFVEQNDYVTQGYFKAAMIAVLAYSLLYVFLTEVRYDDHSLFATNFYFQPREYQWKKLLSIKDNGHYLYVLRYEDGRKLELQKNLVGIRDLLSYANDHIEANRRI
jgi:hypothetical protein